MTDAPHSAPLLSPSQRLRRTPWSSRVEAAGVKAYTVYNHMLLATVFRSVEADYWHLRRHVQVWDVACERQVEIAGPDAARLVQLMTPRDLSKAVAGQCLYAPLVDESGGMVNDPVILKLAEDRFWLSIADSDVRLWAKGLARGMALDVTIREPDVWPLAVQGPRSDDLMAAVFGDEVRAIGFFRFRLLDFRGHSFVVARSGWSRQSGFEIYVDDRDLGVALWDELFEAGRPFDVGPGCPNAIERVEAGLLSYGNDMTGEHTPFECGLDRYCHLDRPIDFLGRAALEASVAEGPARRIVGLAFEAPSVPGCVMPWPVLDGDRIVGQVTSAATSPALGTGIALAMVDRGWWEPGLRLTVVAPDGPSAATVSALPFIVPPA